MAENLGRTALLKKDGTVIAGVRTKSISWSGESINITTGEDDGLRTLLGASGEEQIDIPVDGLSTDDIFLNIALTPSTSKMLTDITVEFDIRNPTNTTNATLSGNFRLSSYEEGMPYNEAITFSATLESSGAWVFTPEAV